MAWYTAGTAQVCSHLPRYAPHTPRAGLSCASEQGPACHLCPVWDLHTWPHKPPSLTWAVPGGFYSQQDENAGNPAPPQPSPGTGGSTWVLPGVPSSGLAQVRCHLCGGIEGGKSSGVRSDIFWHLGLRGAGRTPRCTESPGELCVHRWGHKQGRR